MKLNNQKGFTLVELIVVIAIIAILAAIVIVNVSGYIAKSRSSSAVTNLGQLETLSAKWAADGKSSTFDSFCNTIGYGETVYDAMNSLLYSNSTYSGYYGCSDYMGSENLGLSMSSNSNCHNTSAGYGNWYAVFEDFVGGSSGSSSNVWHCVDSNGNVTTYTGSSANSSWQSFCACS